MGKQTENASVIREAQTIIVRLSNFTDELHRIAIDGIYGEQTESQVRAFQNYIGVPETGVLDRDTFAQLVKSDHAIDLIVSESNTISPFGRRLAGKEVSPGDSFDLVEMIQLMLKTIGLTYDLPEQLKVTGHYDENTEAAIKNFQKINNLPESGSVDMITWNRLARSYNKYVDSEGD